MLTDRDTGVVFFPARPDLPLIAKWMQPDPSANKATSPWNATATAIRSTVETPRAWIHTLPIVLRARGAVPVGIYYLDTRIQGEPGVYRRYFYKASYDFWYRSVTPIGSRVIHNDGEATESLLTSRVDGATELGQPGDGNSRQCDGDRRRVPHCLPQLWTEWV